MEYYDKVIEIFLRKKNSTIIFFILSCEQIIKKIHNKMS